MSTERYTPSGELQGDTKPMPDRGTSTGLTDSYGADTDQSAINRQGSLDTGTKSSPWADMPGKDA